MSEYRRINIAPEQEERLRELDGEFKRLCDEQDLLNVNGFAEVFRVLDRIEDDFTPSNPCTENIASIDKALELAGKSGDEAFCRAFKRNNEIILRGREIRREKIRILSAGFGHNQQDCTGWQFVDFHFIAPKRVMDIWMEELERDAKQGTGFFEVITNIPDEDEDEDELLMVDKYELKSSLTQFWDDLKQYGVIGDDDVDGLFPLPKIFRKALLRVLSDNAKFAKDNTDKPAKVRNHILKALRAMDGKSVIFLFLQILLLQGLLRWLEGVTLDEDEDGYIELQSLYCWLVGVLWDKETSFICMPFGDDDKKQLKPLCDYLYSTEVGRALQEVAFGKADKAHSEAANSLDGTSAPASEQKHPSRAKWRTERAIKYFAKAVKAGFMEQIGDDRYHWTYNYGSKASLAYFIEKVYDPKMSQQIPFKEVGQVFGVKRLAQARNQLTGAKALSTVGNHKFAPPIDELFKD